jgi:hypothetical protein
VRLAMKWIRRVLLSLAALVSAVSAFRFAEYSAAVAALLVIAASGVFGGFASYVSAHMAEPLGNDPDNSSLRKPPFSPRDILSHVTMGLLAAFVMPLFLSLIQSDLMTNILANKDGDEALYLFALGGFCLVAAFSSRTFMVRVTDKVLALDREVRQLRAATNAATAASEDAKTTAQQAAATSEEAKEIAEDGPGATEEENSPDDRDQIAEGTVREQNVSVDELNSNERAVLAALAEKPTTRRLVLNISRDANISLSATISALESLRQKRLVIRYRNTSKGTSLYARSARGRAFSGQAS